MRARHQRKNLERWVQGIVARVLTQESLEIAKKARASREFECAVSNSHWHPCQALADFFTLEERFGNLRGFKLAYVGTGTICATRCSPSGARVGVSSG